VVEEILIEEKLIVVIMKLDIEYLIKKVDLIQDDEADEVIVDDEVIADYDLIQLDNI